jgi:hypothetical protein
MLISELLKRAYRNGVFQSVQCKLINVIVCMINHLIDTQVRGAVVKDARGGGLQMMSQGDPPLILSYCKEYWDGKITEKSEGTMIILCLG